MHEDAHVHLCVKLPRLEHCAIARGESRVAAALRKGLPTSLDKPGGFHPVTVVMDATALQLSGNETQNALYL